MTVNYKEIAFEDAVENHLINFGGYIKGDVKNYNRELAMDTDTLFEFIKKSQPKQWDKLYSVHGKSVEVKLINRLNKEINSNGVLSVLRKGIVDLGIYIKLAYFKPVSGMNEDALWLYEQNILSVIRQVKYSTKNENSLDIVLFVNGIPLVTLELKNQYTGQTVENAIRQYKYDRNPTELLFQFNKRAVIHFAVDTDEVYMTTRLSGDKTKFLPFNKGNNGGSGNPNVRTGYKTGYLWEEVLCKDSLLDIVSRFLHLQHSETNFNGKIVSDKTLIFPRYHQLDVVRKLEQDTKRSSDTKNYLIQHSAGSGKSNSIAWLSYRLATIHSSDDKPVFNSVVVVTDRRVLDNQLQDTIYQFEHKQGFIERIDKNSDQLAEALNVGKKIIITTIQKFPFVINKVKSLAGKRFAVIIDEAHSSQSGEAARKLKEVLTDKSDTPNMEGENESDFQDEILKELTSHGKQKNISFFAFTATPKSKTLEIFGNKDEVGSPCPFHLYSMRQAIEEGFILNVLENYVTYNTYFKLAKGIEEDPEFIKTKAKRAINKFLMLHPRTILQKSEIIVEHIKDKTLKKINGNAKAMLVTSSRLQAVKYYFECKKYAKEHNYKDIGVLVAFSGVVHDNGVPYTEESLNHFSESQLPAKFSMTKYNLLIVADKYQTGFDQPLLHTMFIDKKLSGVRAVQTLSRLNRTCKEKYDSFVMDFANTTEEITSSFQPYFEQTSVSDVTDPNIIYDLKNKLDGFGVYWDSEIQSFAKVFFKPANKQYPEDHSILYQTVNPAVDRFKQKTIEEQRDFKGTLRSFVRYYTFICQIVKLNDIELHKLHAYSKFLFRRLPELNDTSSIDLSEDVALEYYRLEICGEVQNIKLNEGEDAKLSPISLTSKLQPKEEKIPLSKIIDEINQRFGTDFKDMDKAMEGFLEDCAADLTLTMQAQNNSIENFKYPFNEAILGIILDRSATDKEFINKYLDDDKFQAELNRLLLPIAYERLRKER